MISPSLCGFCGQVDLWPRIVCPGTDFFPSVQDHVGLDIRELTDIHEVSLSAR
jgi:hypothetical protein